jgi:hypothetical protein
MPSPRRWGNAYVDGGGLGVRVTVLSTGGPLVDTSCEKKLRSGEKNGRRKKLEEGGALVW